MKLDHGLGSQITCWQHLQSLHQFHHGIIVLVVREATKGALNLNLMIMHLEYKCHSELQSVITFKKFPADRKK